MSIGASRGVCALPSLRVAEQITLELLRGVLGCAALRGARHSMKNSTKQNKMVSNNLLTPLGLDYILIIV